MFSINCKNCDGTCCTSRKKNLHVVLTPQEEDKFKDFSTVLATTHGNLSILKKTESGDCIFYDSKTNLCKSYQNRPFDCRTFPLVIHFSEAITFFLDDAVCPKTKECSLGEIEKTKREWLRQCLPLNWIKAYSEVD